MVLDVLIKIMRFGKTSSKYCLVNTMQDKHLLKTNKEIQSKNN
jgi:hypothetical protein